MLLCFGWDYVDSVPVFLSQSDFYPPQDIWHYLEMFWLVLLGACSWHAGDGARDAAQHLTMHRPVLCQ